MNDLEKAIKLAGEVHRNQLDKGGTPYILHPLRLMLQMEEEAEMIAAVLHDVVEDTDLEVEDLRQRGFPEEAVEAIECLTKREGEDYDTFISRVEKNPLAAKVKIADLRDNMNMERIPEVGPGDLKRLARYHRALNRLKRIKS